MKSSSLNPRPVQERIAFANLKSFRVYIYPDVLLFPTDGPQNCQLLLPMGVFSEYRWHVLLRASQHSSQVPRPFQLCQSHSHTNCNGTDTQRQRRELFTYRNVLLCVESSYAVLDHHYIGGVQ